MYGGVTAVDGLDFHVEQGERVGLIGPNGAGKTTTLHIIGGEIKASGGRVEFMGKRIDGLKPHQICRGGIGRTFQIVRVFENLTRVRPRPYGGPHLPRRKGGDPSTADVVDEALALTGLDRFAHVPARISHRGPEEAFSAGHRVGHPAPHAPSG